MPKLSIPEAHRAGITKIKDFDDAIIHKLRAALENAPSISALTSTSLLPIISNLDLENPKQIAETLSALYRVKSTRDVANVEEFVDDVSEAMGECGPTRDKLNANLIALLSIEELELSAKAWDLQTDDERSFCHGRILTDLRPVFGVDVSEGPKAMVIVHLLKIGYQQFGVEKHKEFVVSLDAEDLKTLRKLVDRAEAKAKSLKAAITNFSYLARS